MEKKIAVIRGDGIGPEIIGEAVAVLDAVAALYGHTFTYDEVIMGGEACNRWGDPLPPEMLQKCLDSDSVLLGAVGGPKWNALPAEKRPEKGLLRLRSGMEVFSNNRPAKIWPQLADASPLRPEIVARGIDFIIVRELTGPHRRHLLRRAPHRPRRGDQGRGRDGLHGERDRAHRPHRL